MKIAFSLLLVVLASACGSYSPSLGSAPFACGSGANGDPMCPDGYICVMNGSATPVCSNGGEVPDAPAGACQNDSALEPNNTYQTAHIFGSVPNGDFKLAGLAICPAGDVDTYAFTTAEGQTMGAALTYDPNQAVLIVNLLNSTGAVIAQSQANGTGMAKANLAADTPAGQTYVQVSVSPTSTTITTNGNYQLEITLH
jgi:hypothetical protein